MLQVKSYDSVKTISVDRDELMTALRVIAARILIEHPEVLSIRLFGSVARGDQVGTSDADVLIVVRGAPPVDPLEQIRKFYAYFKMPVPVDLLVFGEEDVRRRIGADPWFDRVWTESLDLS